MRAVFLDFDGPIIPLRAQMKGGGINKTADSSCIQCLNHVTETTGASIVVSSTWRMYGLPKLRSLLKKWGATGNVIGITPTLESRTASGIWQSAPRGLEIAEFIKNWNLFHPKDEIQNFVIFDDDRDMDYLMPFLIHTPYEKGITQSDADLAIERLGEMEPS